MSNYHSWPSVRIYYHDNSTRTQEAFEWISTNISEYQLKRELNGALMLYIQDPKLVMLFNLKFYDVCHENKHEQRI